MSEFKVTDSNKQWIEKLGIDYKADGDDKSVSVEDFKRGLELAKRQGTKEEFKNKAIKFFKRECDEESFDAVSGFKSDLFRLYRDNQRKNPADAQVYDELTSCALKAGMDYMSISGESFLEDKGIPVTLTWPENDVDKGAAMNSLEGLGLEIQKNGENGAVIKARDKYNGREKFKIKLEIESAKSMSVSAGINEIFNNFKKEENVQEIKLDINNIGRIEIKGENERALIYCYSKDGKTVDVYKCNEEGLR